MSCHTDIKKTKGYQQGYIAGEQDGRAEICQDCENNAEDNHQDEVCSAICD
ncbi:MAG: hypothetical protein GY821_05425 [Gammaproteobacteria bacterium]|nr:hypothetical protein [Gammaproteobacteria bacterium]